MISYDRLVLKANCSLYVSFDSEQAGEMQAQYVSNNVPHGNYVIIKGPASDYNSVLLSKGVHNVLDPLVKSGKIKIVKETFTNDWMADEASEIVSRLLENGQKINAVIAENDGLASGAITALSENQLVTSVPVSGMDADLAACQRIVEGQQLMTVYKPIPELADAAANYAVKLANGEPIIANGKISDGRYTIPYYKIAPVAVSKNNMVETVIQDGFHKMNDVYMNIPYSSWPTQ